MLLFEKEVKKSRARQDPWNEADMQGKQRVIILVHIILHRFPVLTLFLTTPRS